MLSLVQRIIAQQQVVRPLPAPTPTVVATPVTQLGCVDISNYTSPLTAEALIEWKYFHKVGLVIVQAIDPPLGYPAGKTRQQIEQCAVAGIPTDIYLFLWTHSNVEADMRDKLAVLNGLEDHVGRVWLDVEDTADATVEQRVTSVRQALAVLDGWSSAHGKPRPGLYSGRWYFMEHLANTTEFSDRDLWTSDYDGIEDAAVFKPYGGWTRCAIKQFVGSTSLAGVTGVDLNILAPTG